MDHTLKVKKSTIKKWVFFIMFIFMWILFGWNYNNADYSNYKDVYNYIGANGNYLGIEPGYVFTCKLGNLIGLNYNNFLIVYSLIGLILIANSIKKYTKNYIGVFILYFIYPFFLDIVQTRNFMAMSIIIYSIRYLIDYKKYNWIKYGCLVLIASSFHITALFYFSFLLIYIKNNKKLMIIAIIFNGILLVTESFMPIILSRIVKHKSYNIYFTQGTQIYTKVAFIIYLAMNLLLAYYSYKSIKINKRNNYQVNFAEIMMKINIIILIVYPFLCIDVDFVRLYRNILPLNYALFLMIKVDGKFIKKGDKILYNLILIIFVLISSYAFIYFQNYKSVVQPIFKYNKIFNM